MKPPSSPASATVIAEQVRGGAVDPRSILDATLDAIEKRDSSGAFLRSTGALARGDLEQWCPPAGTGPAANPGPLAGIPVGVKDNICVAGVPTTCGSRMLEDFVPCFDATVVARIREAGGLVVGKTNMDEFGMGSSNEHSAFHPVLNPWDPNRVAGGSSGGSAAAVAAGLVPVALGSDTGGSVRQPASFCGVFGLKPTYGRLSRYGLVAYASSLDQVGCFGRTTGDVNLLYSAIAGSDLRDATSRDATTPDPRTDGTVSGMKIGLAESTLAMSGVDAEMVSRIRETASVLEDAGAEIIPVDLPDPEFALSMYYFIAAAEASSNLARYDGVRYGRRESVDDLETLYTRTRSRGFGVEVKRRILLGTFALSAGYIEGTYGKAEKGRRWLRSAFEDRFAKVDLLLLPTTPAPAFTLGERVDDPVAMLTADLFTVYANLVGIPALNVPVGSTEGGLPLGAQLLAPAWREDRLFAAAQAVEQDGRWPVRVADGARGSRGEPGR